MRGRDRRAVKLLLMPNAREEHNWVRKILRTVDSAGLPCLICMHLFNLLYPMRSRSPSHGGAPKCASCAERWQCCSRGQRGQKVM